VWAVLGVAEEPGAFGVVVAELVAEDAKRPGRIAEAACHVGGTLLVGEEGAERLVLALERFFGGEKEGRRLGVR
jgi:hypothetical protein